MIVFVFDRVENIVEIGGMLVACIRFSSLNVFKNTLPEGLDCIVKPIILLNNWN